MALRIYLCRHGQTDWNAQHRLQGWTDIPLNERGRQQAIQLRDRFSGVSFDRIYCSALQRSRQTAELIAGAVPVIPVPELNEQRHGCFEGKVLDGSDPELLKEYRRRRENPEDSLDGGESRQAHRDRIAGALRAIREAHPDGVVLIVGHGGTNSLILQILSGRSDDLMFQIQNTDVFVIDLQDPPQLQKMND